jgi:hypothetical protein
MFCGTNSLILFLLKMCNVTFFKKEEKIIVIKVKCSAVINMVNVL